MRRSHLFLTLVALLFALPTLTLTAQDTPTGWPVETRCVGEPTTPPEGWTFPGAILMTGNFGIHAVHAGWDTPQVVAFVHDYIGFGDAGLSPDGRWFATIEVYYHFGEVISRLYGAEETGLRIYSTVNVREEYVVPWENSYTGIFNAFPEPYPQLLWLDNEHLLYTNGQGATIAKSVVNPFTAELGDATAQLQQGHLDYLQPSPDWTRGVYGVLLESIWIITDGNTATDFLKNTIKLTATWKPDSSEFVAYMEGYEGQEKVVRFVLYDREGNFLDLISQGEIIWDTTTTTTTTDWSPDGRYLAYIAGDKKELHLADAQTKTVRNLCVSTDSLSWSPDGKQLALLKMGDYKQRQQPVLIFDLASDQLHTVAYHSGRIIGWRED